MNRITINPRKDLIFDLKVREMCKSCKRYGKKATCPPYLDSVEYYEGLLPRYKSGILYYKKFTVQNNWVKQGKSSSLEIYEKIILKRRELRKNSHYFLMAFGAGSCKLCDKCTFPCKLPDRSLVPFEATGIDIVKMMMQFDIAIEFPVNNHFYRIGAIFYD